MADICITQVHELPHDEAKAAAQKVANQMSKEFDMRTIWDGDVLHFTRDGVSGKLALLANEARLELQLGLLFNVFASAIEAKISAKMAAVFAS